MKKLVYIFVLVGIVLLFGAANTACEAQNITEGLRACTGQIIAGAILLIPGFWKVATNR